LATALRAWRRRGHCAGRAGSWPQALVAGRHGGGDRACDARVATRGRLDALDHARTLAARIGVNRETVRRLWRDHGLKPWRSETFKLSSDPRFEEKLVDVVGLYLNPPARAVVFSFDETTQVQALDRTQPSLPIRRDRAQTLTHDYKRQKRWTRTSHRPRAHAWTSSSTGFANWPSAASAAEASAASTKAGRRFASRKRHRRCDGSLSG